MKKILILIASILAFSAFAFGAELYVTMTIPQVTTAQGLYEVCKDYVGIYSKEMQGRVKRLNNLKTSWVTGETIRIPIVIYIEYFQVADNIYRCDELAEEAEMTLEKFKELFPEAKCIE